MIRKVSDRTSLSYPFQPPGQGKVDYRVLVWHPADHWGAGIVAGLEIAVDGQVNYRHRDR